MESMSKLGKLDTAKQQLESAFEDLRGEKLNARLLGLMRDPTPSSHELSTSSGTRGKDPAAKYETLYDFVNEESVKKLIDDAALRYQQLEVPRGSKPDRRAREAPSELISGS